MINLNIFQNENIDEMRNTCVILKLNHSKFVYYSDLSDKKMWMCHTNFGFIYPLLNAVGQTIFIR